jgi:hypothetical protein
MGLVAHLRKCLVASLIFSTEAKVVEGPAVSSLVLTHAVKPLLVYGRSSFGPDQPSLPGIKGPDFAVGLQGFSLPIR